MKAKNNEAETSEGDTEVEDEDKGDSNLMKMREIP